MKDPFKILRYCSTHWLCLPHKWGWSLVTLISHKFFLAQKYDGMLTLANQPLGAFTFDILGVRSSHWAYCVKCRKTLKETLRGKKWSVRFNITRSFSNPIQFDQVPSGIQRFRWCWINNLLPLWMVKDLCLIMRAASRWKISLTHGVSLTPYAQNLWFLDAIRLERV